MGVLSWLFGRQVKKSSSELTDFCNELRLMTPYQLGFIVAIATHMRNELADKSLPFMDPFKDIQKSISATYTLTRLMRLYRSKKETLDEQAAMVWMYTFKAATMPGLELAAVDMWRELGRGFPSVEDSAEQMMRLTYKRPVITGYDQYPLGLEPPPL